MKGKIFKTLRITCFLTVLTLCFGNIAMASAQISKNYERDSKTIHRVYCIVRDADGNVTSEGELPLNEEEANSRQNWGRHVLQPGGSVSYYQSGNQGFQVLKGSTINFSFGLDSNVNISAAIKRDSGGTLAERSGLMGGLGMNAQADATMRYHGYVKNYSSSTVAITYASFSY